MKIPIRIEPACPKCGLTMAAESSLEKTPWFFDIFYCLKASCKNYYIKYKIVLTVEAEEVK